MKRNIIVKILICAVAASVFAGESGENEDVSGFIRELKNIILRDPEKGYMQSAELFKSQKSDKKYEYATAILERVVHEDFGSDSAERDIYRTALRILKRGDRFKNDNMAGKILYDLFINKPYFCSALVFMPLYEMRKYSDLDMDEFQKQLVSGRARILELAIHWDLDCFQDDIEEILNNPNSKWGVEEKLVIGGKRTQPRTIQIYPSAAFNTHAKCRELGKNNHVPAQYVYVKDLAKAYLARCGDQEELSALQNGYAEASPAKADRDVKDRDKNYYYALLYLIGSPPGPCPFIPLQ